MKNPCLVIIPAYNAEETLPTLLEKLSQEVDMGNVVIVDDGSTDETARTAGKLGAKVIRHGRNRGKGAALKTGFEAALSNGKYDAIVTMDADLQHDPSDIGKFLRERETGGAAIVLGRRQRWRTAMPLARKLSNSLTSFLVSARTRTLIQDSQCGYRLIGTEVLERVTIESTGFEAETEFLIKAARKGFKISSVPIQTVYGNEKSAMTHWTTTKRFIQTLLKDY